MNRFLSILVTVTTVAVAGTASALPMLVDFPTLTYPPQPTPETSQACTDLTTLNDDFCTATSK